MNLSDTVATFQTDVELVHEFVKGDKTVIVHGSDGQYPSLAKIAADSLVVIANANEDFAEALDVNQAALIASQEALAGLFHLASGVVGKSYSFSSTKELHIKHHMGTRVFTKTIIGSDGAEVYASSRPIDETEFVVDFTDYEEGNIIVMFYLNT